jgi:hypothetical protein
VVLFTRRGWAIGIVLAAGYAPVSLCLSLLPETKDQVDRALASLQPGPEAPQLIPMKLQFALGLALVFMMGQAERIKSALGLPRTRQGSSAMSRLNSRRCGRFGF